MTNPRVLGVELAAAVQTSTPTRARREVERARLTPAIVDRLAAHAAPSKSNRFVYDTLVPELAVRVTPAPSAAKAFVVYMWSRAKRGRISYTLGNCEQLALAEARQLAREAVAAIARGEDPVEKRRAARAEHERAELRGVTVDQVHEDYLAARKDLAPRTRYDYRKILETQLASWRKLPLASITKSMVEERHAEIGRGDERRRIKGSPARANYAMRYVRLLFNFAADRYEVDGAPVVFGNPVQRLNRAKAWYTIAARKTHIKPEQLPAWWKALQELKNDAGRDYLEALLLSGLRKTEGLRLAWAGIDMQRRTFRALDTKNGTDHELPMSEQLYRLFARRAQLIAGASPWVFPGVDLAQPMTEPRKCIARVVRTSGVHFTCHDLRRSFLRIAELHVQPPLTRYLIKRLANHSVRGDVTGGYIQVDTENLRGPMQAIANFVACAANSAPAPSPAAANEPSWRPPGGQSGSTGRESARRRLTVAPD